MKYSLSENFYGGDLHLEVKFRYNTNGLFSVRETIRDMTDKRKFSVCRKLVYSDLLAYLENCCKYYSYDGDIAGLRRNVFNSLFLLNSITCTLAHEGYQVDLIRQKDLNFNLTIKEGTRILGFVFEKGYFRIQEIIHDPDIGGFMQYDIRLSNTLAPLIQGLLEKLGVNFKGENIKDYLRESTKLSTYSILKDF